MQDSLAVVNHRHFEPGSARTQNWDPGYEETVLKEAAEEMNELDAAMKEVRLHFKYSKNPRVRTWWFTNLLEGICHFNIEK